MSAAGDADKPCKLCGAPSRFLCDTYNEHGRISTIKQYRCGACGLVFVGNELNPELLGEAYGTLDQKAYYAEVGKTEEKKFETCLKNLSALGIQASARVIDIGTGNGDFLIFLKSAGFAALAGHDIPCENTERLDAAGIPVYQDFDYSNVPPGAFDAATLLDVMEHVLDPVFTAQSVFKMLKPGGWIYIHTPCVTVTDRLMHLLQKLPLLNTIGRTWQRGRTSIFHLQNFTEKSMTQVLSRAGFEAIHFEQRNELSWPVHRYVRIYICQKLKLPNFLAWLATPFLYPFLKTSLFNSNKGMIWAKKPATER